MSSAMEANRVKRILEAALLAAQQPLSLYELKSLFDEVLSSDLLRRLLEELREEWRDRPCHVNFVVLYD